MRGGPPYTGREGYGYRPSGPPFPRGPDPNNYSPRLPSSSRTPDSSQTPASSSNVDTNTSNTPTTPAGPASWRRAQQYRQDRPFQQDYRAPYPPSGPGRGAPFPRTSPRAPLPSTPQSPATGPPDPAATSPTANRIPTGPRALARHEPVAKKEYKSRVPDLDEKVLQIVTSLILARKTESGT